MKKYSGPIEKHWDISAEKYDKGKKNSRYYYDTLKKIPLKYFSKQKKQRVLEVGCGTGQIIANFNPKYGVGIDISKNMINVAKKKHKNKNLKFKVDDVEDLKIKEKFDIVIMTDVAEHLTNLDKAVKNLKKCMHKDSLILITTPNPLWTPVLEAAEKLNLKMEEGPHKWISLKYIDKTLKLHNFKILKLDTSLLVPIYIPWISEMINNVFWHIPIIRKIGLIQIVTAKLQN